MDTNIEEIENIVYGEIYKLINDVEDRFDVNLSHFLLTNMARRLASSDYPLDQAIEEVIVAYRDQQAYNAKPKAPTLKLIN
jgi:hypothetical protein